MPERATKTHQINLNRYATSMMDDKHPLGIWFLDFGSWVLFQCVASFLQRNLCVMIVDNY